MICRIDAKASTAEPLMLAAHADTVKPGRGITPVVEEGIIRSQGETILGADDKAGIAGIFVAVRTAVKHPPLEIVITRSEEVGLLGAKNFGLLDALRQERILARLRCAGHRGDRGALPLPD
ncbi:MAG TPA: M28 family peptidase [Candidatus Heimdallarchaeota archaeon]|nr:M28 family peptidase [Candidatus Heimdallarchaeota archaeon]